MEAPLTYQNASKAASDDQSPIIRVIWFLEILTIWIVQVVLALKSSFISQNAFETSRAYGKGHGSVVTLLSTCWQT